MSLKLFDSVNGELIHYYIRPNDDFVLNSLEKLDADTYLYRLLREEGFEQIFFIDINEDSCSVVAYDKLSYWATEKPDAFSAVDVQDPKAIAAFVERAEGKDEPEKTEKTGPAFKNTRVTARKPTKKVIPQVGRCQMQRFKTPEEFGSFMLNRISPALKRKNAKSAVVIPMEIFEKPGYIADVTISTFRVAQKDNRDKKNLIVLVEVLDGLPNGQWRAAAALDVLRKEGVLVQSDKIYPDEIANLLLRKKLVERDPRFAPLQVSKIYGLAEMIAELCMLERNQFKTLKPFVMHDFIRQLDSRLARDEVVEELLEKAAGLKGRTPVNFEKLNALELQRTTGRIVERAQRSQEELLQDYEIAMRKLHEFVGLEAVQEKIKSKFHTLRTSKRKKGPGHYIFTGNPGTGKTEVARLMGEIFKAMGLLRKGHLVECNAGDLIAGYVGQTALKTREMLEKALDGVLFVDEAYRLVNTEPNGQKFASDFAEEAYTELMTFMENHRDRICLIFAGYADKMRFFRDANPGMAGRIGKNVIHFPDYNVDELLEILKRFAKNDEDGFTVTPEFEVAIRRVIEDMVSSKDENFCNGRQMRELFESCKDCAAERFVRTGDESSKFTLTAEDIPEELRYNVSETELQEAFRELKSLIGLDSVKQKLERQLNVVRAYQGKNGPGHYIFTGNPGTGKTEVARLLGKIFKAMGLLRKGHLVECKKADLVAGFLGQTPLKTRAKCLEALDGVLFIDEAYDFVNTEPNGIKFKTSFDEEAYNELMTFMENNRKRVCVIFAGYPDQMRCFRDANPGMASRVGESNIIPFPVYNPEELFQILKRFAEKDEGKFRFAQDFEQEIRQVIQKMVKSKQATFGNAREMRDLFFRCKECAAQRAVKTTDEDLKYTLLREDIPSEFYPRASQEEFDKAMQELDEMIGLGNVKKALRRILDMKLIYEDERCPGHFVFAGNPGTGKTVVARMLGKIFKAMGMLRSGHVVECSKADLVMGSQTALKTRAMLESALDGVFFLDEAYKLIETDATGLSFKSPYDEEAYTEIMSFMENNRHRVCVIFAGYDDKMEKFMRANDGMRSRVSNVVEFPDYSDEELVKILELMAKEEGFTLAPGTEEAVRRAIMVRKQECVGQFGNGREVRDLFVQFKQNLANRMKQLHYENHMEELAAQKYILTPEDTLVGSMRDEVVSVEEAMNELAALIGLDTVKDMIRTLAHKIMYPADTSKRPEPGHYVFAGNPGTGKTEVARLLGKILRAIGVLAKGHVVEVSSRDLVAGYVGQTAIKTTDRCMEAIGGILFVDEAYMLLAENESSSFGKEALDTIMKFMEDNRDKVCVIFAGYEEPMRKLMQSNVGFDSRITEVIPFPDYSAEELVQIMRYMAGKQKLELAEDFVKVATELLNRSAAAKRSTFGNAREVRKLLSTADGNRASRIAAAVQRGEDPKNIRMNLLIAEDLGPRGAAGEKAAKRAGQTTTYKRIKRDSIEQLKPSFGAEALENRVTLGAATDNAVLFVETDRGYGTAVLISPDGYALTCNHVISGTSSVRARLRIPGRMGGDDSWHNCQVINTKMDLDLALIKLEGSNFPYLLLAAEDRPIRKGEEIILSGYPFGARTSKDLTTFNGYVASTEKQTDENGFIRYNINCEAKRGDSGAPVISLVDGRVIGILLGSMTEGRGTGLTEEINYMRPVQYFWEEFLE